MNRQSYNLSLFVKIGVIYIGATLLLSACGGVRDRRTSVERKTIDLSQIKSVPEAKLDQPELTGAVNGNGEPYVFLFGADRNRVAKQMYDYLSGMDEDQKKISASWVSPLYKILSFERVENSIRIAFSGYDSLELNQTENGLIGKTPKVFQLQLMKNEKGLFSDYTKEFNGADVLELDSSDVDQRYLIEIRTQYGVLPFYYESVAATLTYEKANFNLPDRVDANGERRHPLQKFKAAKKANLANIVNLLNGRSEALLTVNDSGVSYTINTDAIGGLNSRSWEVATARGHKINKESISRPAAFYTESNNQIKFSALYLGSEKLKSNKATMMFAILQDEESYITLKASHLTDLKPILSLAK